MEAPKLTLTERAILANQNRILSHLDDSNADEYRKLAEIAESGYTGLYHELFNHIDTEVPEEVIEETFKILEMFRALDNAVHRLTDAERSQLDTKNFVFKGFDANNDSHYHVMEFLIKRQNKYEELKDTYRNSHNSTTIDIYRNMLSSYEARKTKGSYQLTFDDLKQIASKAN